MTEAEIRLAAKAAEEAMIHELIHCGNRSHAACAERAGRRVYDKLMEAEQERTRSVPLVRESA
jgi:hypothetical protein